MNLDEAITAIKDMIAECVKNGDMFRKPSITDAVVNTKELPNTGADLLHCEYDITLSDGNTIHIDYRSKDKCRTFEVNPDRSIIEVSCSDPKYDFGDAWDELLHLKERI